MFGCLFDPTRQTATASTTANDLPDSLYTRVNQAFEFGHLEQCIVCVLGLREHAWEIHGLAARHHLQHNILHYMPISIPTWCPAKPSPPHNYLLEYYASAPVKTERRDNHLCNASVR